MITCLIKSVATAKLQHTIMKSDILAETGLRADTATVKNNMNVRRIYYLLPLCSLESV